MNFRGRIGRLEVAVGGDSGECGRCSGTIVVGGVDGEVYSIARDGRELSSDEVAEYVAELCECGTCPAACERGLAIEIGGRRAPSQRR